MSKMMRVVAAATVLFAAAMLAPAADQQPVRVSAWYWLNSAPRSEWARDFKNMARMGFTDVALCWGLDAAAWLVRPQDTKYALDSARDAGIGAYIIVWQPEHNSLPRKPEFQQVTVAGRRTFAFNPFNATFRGTVWKKYLQDVAGLTSRHPAFAGYIFDDSFMIGALDRVDGPRAKGEERYISYSEDDIKRYGKQPPKSPSDPDWANWMEARSRWWVDWARDTMKFIREVDTDRRHEVYLEDTIRVFDPSTVQAVGLDFAKVSQPWDAVGAYTTSAWDGTPEKDKKAVEHTLSVIQKTRTAIGPNKKLIYTFWVANPAELRKKGPANYPTVAQIRQICDAALKAGVRHLDMYGYRIGDFIVDENTWPLKRPPATGPYTLTDQYPQKHLFDRTDIHKELGEYLRGLTRKK